MRADLYIMKNYITEYLEPAHNHSIFHMKEIIEREILYSVI